MKNAIVFILLGLVGFSAATQSLPVGTPVIEEAWRIGQLKGELDSNVSFLVRPLQNENYVPAKLLIGKTNISALAKTDSTISQRPRGILLRQLPLVVQQQYNLHHSYSRNDGSLIPAKGYQVRLSTGFFAKLGHVRVQLQPEFVFAQNTPFTSIVSNRNEAFTKTYYTDFLNVIDLPERFGNHSYRRLFPGQSSIRFNLNKFSFGISTENLWWGPGVRNALVMSNNAPGFPHITLNTTAPILSPIGSFEGQVVSGLLKSSGFLPDTTKVVDGVRLFNDKPNDDRYLNGMVLTWQPKWTKGLFLGLSRVYYSYKQDVEPSLNGYLPIVSKLFKAPGSKEETLKRDELLSVFMRLVLPKEQAEIYAEFGRNDHSQNMRDLLLEPEHSRAYLMGFKKLFRSTNGADLELMAEFTSLQVPSTMLVREQSQWYSHFQVRDGYTHQGQIMGASIGPGSSSQTLGLHWVKDAKQSGAYLERVVYNNDLYYRVFATERDFWSHWVDYSLNLNKSWQCGKILYDARLSLVKSLNYQWRRDSDVHFFYAGVSASYLF